jgi:hypothetical protein
MCSHLLDSTIRPRYVGFGDSDWRRNKDYHWSVAAGTEVDCPEKVTGGRLEGCRHRRRGKTAVLLVYCSPRAAAVPGAMALLLGTAVMNDAASTCQR